jgi:hypothetical protein
MNVILECFPIRSSPYSLTLYYAYSIIYSLFFMSFEREVSLDSIDLRTIPINWTAVARMGRSINNLKDEPLIMQEFALIRELKEPLYPAIPMVASVTAHQRNPEIPIIYPTEEQVKAMKPSLGFVSFIIGRFSNNWQAKFDRYLKQEGTHKVMGVAEKVFSMVRVLENTQYDHPRERFIDGLEVLYSDLSQSETEQGGFLGLEEVERPIEKKILQLIQEVRSARFRDGHGRYFNSDRHPFLSKLLRVANSVGINFPSAPLPTLLEPNSDEKAAIAGSEVMGGIEIFLRSNSRQNIPAAPRPMEFDIFNFGSYMRAAAEIFNYSKLERVKAKLPEVLNQAADCIPEKPSAVAERIYEIAEDIVILKQQGRTDKEIAESLISNWKKSQIATRLEN